MAFDPFTAAADKLIFGKMKLTGYREVFVNYDGTKVSACFDGTCDDSNLVAIFAGWNSKDPDRVNIMPVMTDDCIDDVVRLALKKDDDA